jgi:hypothetical protein
VEGLGFAANVFVGVAGLDLPKVHNPFGAALALRIGAYRVEGGVEASFGSDATLAGTDDTKGADFSLVVGTLVACRALLPWRPEWPVPALEPTLHACVGLEAGAMTGEGFGVADPETGTAPWVAPRLEARGGLGIAGPLSFWLKAGAAFRSTRAASSSRRAPRRTRSRSSTRPSRSPCARCWARSWRSRGAPSACSLRACGAPLRALLAPHSCSLRAFGAALRVNGGVSLRRGRRRGGVFV